jgi:hypothetical protein
MCIRDSLLVACSSNKSIPYTAQRNAPFAYFDEGSITQKDPKSGLEYSVINDDAYLYINLKTRHPRTINNIITSGLRISFSPEQDKRDAYILSFPFVTKEDRKALKRVESDIPNSLGLKLLLEAYNKEALWKTKQAEYLVNLLEIHPNSIKASIVMTPEGELQEQITIPLNQINTDLTKVNRLGMSIQVEGSTTGQSGFGLTPGVSIGMGSMMGMGGMGGISLGTGGRNGYYNNNDQGVNIKLDVSLATSNQLF